MTSADIHEIDLEITSHCNLHCPQCPRYDNHGNLNKYLVVDHLRYDQIKKNLDISRFNNLSRVIFEGDHGDALAHPEIMRFVRHFAQVPEVMIITNGSMRAPEWWRQLATTPNVRVTFSIDGLADTNNRYRINAQWDRIITNAKSYIQAGGYAVWKMLVFQHNQHQVAEVQKLAKELGFQDMRIEYTNRNWSAQGHHAVYVNNEYRYDIRISDQAPMARMPSAVAAIQRLNGPYQAPVCSWRKRGKIYINYRGHVLPCCMTSSQTWSPDISGQLWQRVVGNVDAIDLHHHDLVTILSSDFFRTRLPDSLASADRVHHVCVSNCS